MINGNFIQVNGFSSVPIDTIIRKSYNQKLTFTHTCSFISSFVISYMILSLVHRQFHDINSRKKNTKCSKPQIHTYQIPREMISCSMKTSANFQKNKKSFYLISFNFKTPKVRMQCTIYIFQLFYFTGSNWLLLFCSKFSCIQHLLLNVIVAWFRKLWCDVMWCRILSVTQSLNCYTPLIHQRVNLKHFPPICALNRVK